MSKSNGIHAAKKLLEHKDFGIMCLLKVFLEIEGFYSDLGIFLSREDILYLSFFFKVKGCGNTIYKLNINFEKYSRDYSPLFRVGFTKNNHNEFDEEEKNIFDKIKNEVITKVHPQKTLDSSTKNIQLGVFAASDLTELVNVILKNYEFKKTDDDLADVSSGDFISLAKAKEVFKTVFE